MSNLEESMLRPIVFVSVFIVMALVEATFPRKTRTQKRSKRWIANWGMIILGTLTLRACMPILAVGFAATIEEQNWGLFAFTPLPAWLEIIVAVVLLDFAIYWQHRASHSIGLLWRIHQVHHVDRDLDVTTAFRFHPLEILLSMVFKLVCVLLLGPAAVAVLIFEIMLNACAMFNHTNVKLPLSVDRILRTLIVTPDMHRVHHSVVAKETHSNFGFCLALWDRLFQSYTHAPKLGHEAMTIGLQDQQTQAPSSLLWSLALPFTAKRSQNDS